MGIIGDNRDDIIYEAACSTTWPSQTNVNRFFANFASIPTKQWLQVKLGNEIVIHFLLSFISSLDFKPSFVPIEANSGSVHLRLSACRPQCNMAVYYCFSAPPQVTNTFPEVSL